jgi:2-polyprenyl-3-methyl-5-hydroxy-6-metoxy-1,4-benzoquinol methylase
MNFRSAACLLVFLAGMISAPAQNPDELEKKIASLPPAEQAYERFRFWMTQRPSDQQKQDPTDAYKAYLKQRGFSGAKITEQLTLVEQQGQKAEVQRWNRILTSDKPFFNTNPNEFLVQMAKGRKPGTALDVGMGQGRNAIWLAQQGWDVTGFDPADKAVALAEQNAKKLGVRLHTEIKGEEDFDFGEKRWDLILLSYVGAREMPGRIQRALKPGGVVIVEAFHRDATKGKSIGGAVVFDTGEVPKLFPGLRVVRYEEPVTKADFGLETVRMVRYCGERPE